jgi:sugar O-acyltransferase (sialic acid O-acetyltransferase NeuD family)
LERNLNIIFGAGGVAREVSWMLQDIWHDVDMSASIQVSVVADEDWTPNQYLDDIPVISESEFIRRYSKKTIEAYIAVGMPDVKRRMLTFLRAHSKASFPNLIHPRSSMDHRFKKVNLGQGNVIYPAVSLTTDINIEDFVHINPGTTIGHECRIGNFCTLCPGVHVSGRVTLGEGCFVGAGAVIKEGLSIAPNCIIGAGAVIIRTISESGRWVGIPAKRLLD